VGRRRVLLDENLPRQLAGELPEHEVSTVAQQGWRGVLNGELLRRAESAGYQVFITGDRNLEYQQTLVGRAFGVVVIFPRRLKMEYLLPLVPAIRDAVASVQPGKVVHVRPLS
jgi:predicted nuclease of predicted toxin-antitoxin system